MDDDRYLTGGGEIIPEQRSASYSTNTSIGPFSGGAILAGQEDATPIVGGRFTTQLPEGLSATLSRTGQAGAPMEYARDAIRLAKQLEAGQLALEASRVGSQGLPSYGLQYSGQIGKQGGAPSYYPQPKGHWFVEAGGTPSTPERHVRGGARFNFADGGEVSHMANGGISYSGDFSTPDYYQVYNALPNAGLAGQLVQRMFPNPSTTGAYTAYMNQLASSALPPPAPNPTPFVTNVPNVSGPPVPLMPTNNFNFSQFGLGSNAAPALNALSAQQSALALPKMVQPENKAHGGEVDAALHAVRHHLAGGGFLSDLFSGPDYLSTGEAASPTNWGDPELASDFFKADKARMALDKRPVVGRPEDDVTGSVPMPRPRPAPEAPAVKIPFEAPKAGFELPNQLAPEREPIFPYTGFRAVPPGFAMPSPVAPDLPAPRASPDVRPMAYAPAAGGAQAPALQAISTATSPLDIRDISHLAQYRGAAMENPQAVVFHHTAGEGTPEGVINTLNTRTDPFTGRPMVLGAHYIIDRDGGIHAALPSGTRGAHILPSKINDLSNANTYGVEVIAKDNSDVTPAQIAAGQRLYAHLSAGRSEPLGVFGHGELNPGHKLPDEGLAIVNPIRMAASPTSATDAAVDTARKVTNRAVNYPELSAEDRDLIAKTIAAEASGKSPEEAHAIANVILNRAISGGRFGKSIQDILFAKNQFEPWSDENKENYPMKFKPGMKAYDAAAEALQKAYDAGDITGGSTYFWAPRAQGRLGRDVPDFAKYPGFNIGATRFHREAREEGGEVDNALRVVREHHADGEAVGPTAQQRLRETIASIDPERSREQPVMDPATMGEAWDRARRNYQNFPVQEGEAVARPLELGARDVIGGAIAGGAREPGAQFRRGVADLLVGSTGLPDSGTLGFGVADAPMITGIPLTVADMARDIGQGDYASTAMGAALPAAFYARGPLGAAGRRAVEIAREYAKPAAAAATGVAGATVAPDEAEAAKLSKLLRSGETVLGAGPVRKAAQDEVSGLFDYSRLHEVPKVTQFDLPRVIPPRGVPERVTDLVANKDVRDKMAEVILEGQRMGGANWYNTDPLLEKFVEQLGPDAGQKAYRKYMDFVAATSPRSDVGTNVRNASYYYGRDMRGEGMPAVGDRNPQPYGHMAQRLHQMNAERVAGPGWDPLNNPKPASFVENLAGNQEPVTVDTHAFRLPAILAKDPRFLETAYLASKDAPKLNIQKLVMSGDMSMEDALKTPAYWQAQPKANEYAAMEQYYKPIGRELGMTPAQTQASAWVGGGKLTGLASDESKPFLRFFDDRIMKTARETGMDPKDVLRDFISGKMSLYSKGGSVEDRALMLVSRQA